MSRDLIPIEVNGKWRLVSYSKLPDMHLPPHRRGESLPPSRRYGGNPGDRALVAYQASMDYMPRSVREDQQVVDAARHMIKQARVSDGYSIGLQAYIES